MSSTETKEVTVKFAFNPKNIKAALTMACFDTQDKTDEELVVMALDRLKSYGMRAEVENGIKLENKQDIPVRDGRS